jgi:hypothetical protein
MIHDCNSSDFFIFPDVKSSSISINDVSRKTVSVFQETASVSKSYGNDVNCLISSVEPVHCLSLSLSSTEIPSVAGVYGMISMIVCMLLYGVQVDVDVDETKNKIKTRVFEKFFSVFRIIFST